MLAQLILRNCLRSKARSLFTVFTVAAALLTNALFASYQARTHGWLSYQPAQKRMALISMKTEGWELPSSLLVAGKEHIALTEVFLGTHQTTMMLYSEPSSLVRPFLSDGAYPVAGGCVVPRQLAESLSLSVGSTARLYVPGQDQPIELSVSGLSSDPLWPYVVADRGTQDLQMTSPRKEFMLIELAPSASPAAALGAVRKLAAGAEVVTLEDMAESLGVSDRQSMSTAEALQARLAAMILSIAALGIANSLALSLIERSSQIGLLEAIGVKRTQTGLMFLAEATLLSLTGGAIALAIAAVLGRAKAALLGDDLVSYVFRGLPWTVGLGLVGCLILLFMWRYETPLSMLRKRAT